MVISLAGGVARCLDLRWDDMIAQARGLDAPALVVYMSDGWSTEVSRTLSVRMGDKAAKRTGTFKAEFLAEKSILKSYDATGTIQMVLKLRKPRLMGAKSGWHIFGASLRDPFVRLSLPDQIIVSMYLQDGLHSASFTRRQRARAWRLRGLRGRVTASALHTSPHVLCAGRGLPPASGLICSTAFFPDFGSTFSPPRPSRPSDLPHPPAHHHRLPPPPPRPPTIANHTRHKPSFPITFGVACMHRWFAGPFKISYATVPPPPRNTRRAMRSTTS